MPARLLLLDNSALRTQTALSNDMPKAMRYLIDMRKGSGSADIRHSTRKQRRQSSVSDKGSRGVLTMLCEVICTREMGTTTEC